MIIFLERKITMLQFSVTTWSPWQQQPMTSSVFSCMCYNAEHNSSPTFYFYAFIFHCYQVVSSQICLWNAKMPASNSLLIFPALVKQGTGLAKNKRSIHSIQTVKFRFKSTGLASDSLRPFWYTTICHTHICMVGTTVNFCIISSQQMRKSISSPQPIGSSHLQW